MDTLLVRPPSDRELALQVSLKKHLVNLTHLGYSRALCQSLGLDNPAPLFAAILAMISNPPANTGEMSLCRYLLAIPDFYCFLSDPAQFERDAMLTICRALMRLDGRFDIKLVTALTDLVADRDTFVRALAVLDDTSAGGRLTMTLARVARDAEPAVAAKVALLMGKRVSNPNWVETQLASPDARVRANVIETLWGADTGQARKWLKEALNDPNNRARGNALVGLEMLGEHDEVDGRVRELAGHPDPLFRMTAAWVMGQTGNADYLAPLRLAARDPEAAVRSTAERAMQTLTRTIEQRNAPAAAPAEPPKKEARSAGDIAMQLRLASAGRFYRR